MHSGHRHNRALRNGAGTGVWSVRPNYRVNLKAQQGEAEANYLRLRRLVPRIGLDQPVEVELPASGWIDERSFVGPPRAWKVAVKGLDLPQHNASLLGCLASSGHFWGLTWLAQPGDHFNQPG